MRQTASPDLVTNTTTSVERLRELLEFPGYGWRDSPRERSRRARQVYWDVEMNEILFKGRA
ncbi:hypothetical protein [Nocardia niigatensis]